MLNVSKPPGRPLKYSEHHKERHLVLRCTDSEWASFKKLIPMEPLERFEFLADMLVAQLPDIIQKFLVEKKIKDPHFELEYGEFNGEKK